MLYFVYDRYAKPFSVSNDLQYNDTQQAGENAEGPFFRTVDKDGNDIVEITANVVGKDERIVPSEDEKRNVLILQTDESRKTFEVGLGPDRQFIFFRNSKLADQLLSDPDTEPGIVTSTTLPSNEILDTLNVGDTVKIQLRTIPELKHYPDKWQVFFLEGKGDVAINSRFVLNINLLP